MHGQSNLGPQRQRSEGEALGTEETETKRTEASFKSISGRRNRKTNFRGIKGNFRMKEAGPMEVKKNLLLEKN